MKKYSANANDYKLYEEVGEGVSATVYRALCIPFNEIVAIKVLDLERCNNDLEGIRREVQTMSLIDHPNVVRAHCSFTTGRHLWVVMPYMAGGSCLHIMKTAYPEGFEQPVIATLLFEVLKALAYLHTHGYIHRDVKAGNILLDSNGTVKLGDFGVSAGMFEGGDRQRPRNTFVGTPCWMAPEVMQQLHGYDFKADIWSFGITALELAHGHAPFSKYPPMKVLLMTLQNAPPGLDYERDKRFSKSFKEIVAACLVKDPKKRPTSDKLLKHHFFKHARSKDLLVRTVLTSLPPLGDRFRTLKAKEANLLMQNQAIHGDSEHLSQQEYIRGISAWNFNIEDLKRQAALIEDSDVIPSKEIQELYSSKIHEHDSASLAGSPSVERTNNAAFETTCEAGLGDVPNVNASAPTEHLVPQEFGSFLDDADVSNAKESFANSSIFKPLDVPSAIEDEKIQMIDEEEQVFQCKGRFRIVSPRKESSSGFSHIIGGDGAVSSTTKSAPLLTSLQNLMQQNSMQKDLILRLIKSADQTADPQMEFADVTSTSENFQFLPASLGRERELQAQVIQMQQSVGRMVEELQRQKMKNAQLEKQLTALRNKRSEG